MHLDGRTHAVPARNVALMYSGRPYRRCQSLAAPPLGIDGLAQHARQRQVRSCDADPTGLGLLP